MSKLGKKKPCLFRQRKKLTLKNSEKRCMKRLEDLSSDSSVLRNLKNLKIHGISDLHSFSSSTSQIKISVDSFQIPDQISFHSIPSIPFHSIHSRSIPDRSIPPPFDHFRPFKASFIPFLHPCEIKSIPSFHSFLQRFPFIHSIPFHSRSKIHSYVGYA